MAIENPRYPFRIDPEIIMGDEGPVQTPEQRLVSQEPPSAIQLERWLDDGGRAPVLLNVSGAALGKNVLNGAIAMDKITASERSVTDSGIQGSNFSGENAVSLRQH